MPDVNILIYAYNRLAKDHLRYAAWLEGLVNGPEPFAVSESVLHGFLRVVTNPRLFKVVPDLADACGFIDGLLSSPQCLMVRPGPLHWKIFRDLLQRPRVRGKIVADAAHAATAIENGCEWVSADTDFAIFAPRLRWQYL